MAKRKIVLLFLVAIVFVFFASTTGCTKCMCCGPWMGQITIIKGADTLYRYYSPGQTGGYVRLQDTVLFYTSQGYTCITGTFGFYGPYTEGGRTCGKEALKQAEAMEYGCVADYTKPDNEPCHR